MSDLALLILALPSFPVELTLVSFYLNLVSFYSRLPPFLSPHCGVLWNAVPFRFWVCVVCKLVQSSLLV